MSKIIKLSIIRHRFVDAGERQRFFKLLENKNTMKQIEETALVTSQNWLQLQNFSVGKKYNIKYNLKYYNHKFQYPILEHENNLLLKVSTIN